MLVTKLGTVNILEAARKNDVHRIIYSSSAAIYGTGVKLPIDEDHPTDPMIPYGVSKLSGEKYCCAYSDIYDLNCICLRYFNVYGPYQNPESVYSGVITKFVYLASMNKPVTVYGDGEQTRDFVHVTDVADANVLSMKIKSCERLNIGSGVETSINDLARVIVKYMKSSSKIVHTSPRMGDPKRGLANIGKAKKILSYHPKVKLSEGIKQLCGMYRIK